MRFLLMVGIAAGIVYGILKFRDRIEKFYGHYLLSDQSLSNGASGGDIPLRGGAGELLRGARPQIAADITASQAIDQDCKPYVTEVQRLDLVKLQGGRYRVQYAQIPQPPETCGFNDPSVTQTMLNARNTCRPTIKAEETINDVCASALYQLRAATTKQVYAMRPVDSLQDPHALLDLLYMELINVNNQTLPNLQRAKAIADRMLELNPKLYVAAKAVVFADVIEAMSSKTRKPGMLAEEWTSAANALARAKAINPSDESLQDAEMLIQTQGFEPSRGAAYAERLLQKNDRNAKAWYLRAYAEWKQGNRPAAIADIRKAASLEPANREYFETAAAASQPHAPESAFRGSISFGMSPADFES